MADTLKTFTVTCLLLLFAANISGQTEFKTTDLSLIKTVELTATASVQFMESGGMIARVDPDGKLTLGTGITAEQAIVKIAGILQRDLPAQAQAVYDQHIAEMKVCMDGWQRALDIVLKPKPSLRDNKK